MFQLHYDTRLDHLADMLADALACRDPARLLEPQTVLVPQQGMRHWLVQRMAERRGIAANLEFVAPAEMVWRVLKAEDPDVIFEGSFDRDVLVWRILEELRRDDLGPRLRELAGDDPHGARGLERASHLARLYERYQGYRRGMLERWARGEEPDEPQAELWRRLHRSGDLSRSELIGAFLDRHEDPSVGLPAGLPGRLFAFGVVNVTPDVLRVLGVLGRHLEMHFYLPTPCREYWGDLPDRRERQARLEAGESLFDDPPNRLLVSLGGVGRDFVARLFAYEEVQPDAEDLGEDAADPPRDSLLERVQADVITLSAPEPKARLEHPDPADRSLQVHVCHSPLREAQVLHDQLLDRMQADPGIEPRDIVVMVPDLARYAPCIEAVFGALPADDPRRIPWTVSDRPQADMHALGQLFTGLLDLPASRLDANEVLDVMAVPAVRRTYGLDEDALPRLAERLDEAGVRWGEDAADRMAHDLPPFEEFSWRFGRRRLLLGYMSGDAAAGMLRDGIAPLTDVEGADGIALGALFALQRRLRTWREAMQAPRPPRAWQALFNEILDHLVPEAADRDEQRVLDTFRHALRMLAEDSRAAGFEQPLDWRSMRAFVREQLGEDRPQQYFLAGGVSVCGLVPLRNVPFKLVCVLGLDAESFPRRDPADALNRLLAGRRLPGDRSVREDDRYLFLQTLMAARKQLYLSYTGIDMRRGTAIEPSVVLSECLEHVCEGYFTDPVAARQALVVTHPMQPFAARQFLPGAHAQGRADVFTYREAWLEAARTTRDGAAPEPFVDAPWPAAGDPEAVVELADLRHFLRNPAEHFLRWQAGLALDAGSAEIEEREPMVLGALQQGRLDLALAASADAQGLAGHALADLRAQGLLPPLDWGRAVFESTRRALEPGLRRMRAWQAAHPPLAPHGVRIELGQGRVLQGVLDGLHEDGYGAWIGNAHSASGWLSWWLGALVAVASGQADECLAWGHDTGKADWSLPWRPAMPDPAQARAHLASLLDMHRAGQREPLPLPLRTAHAWASVQAAKDDEALALKAADKAWHGGFNGYAEKTDPWFALAMRDRELLDDGEVQARFVALARAVQLPLCRALRGGRAA